jgi:SNF2-related domain
MPKLFAPNASTFESWFVAKKGSSKKQIGASELEPEAAEVLHKILRPFFLRRTKEEVLKDLPPKSEVILYTGISLPPFLPAPFHFLKFSFSYFFIVFRFILSSLRVSLFRRFIVSSFRRFIVSSFHRFVVSSFRSFVVS